MKDCKFSCGHREFVTNYRQERQRLEQLAEDRSLGYATELKEYLRDNPIGTFKDYLIQTKRGPMDQPEKPRWDAMQEKHRIEAMRKQDRGAERNIAEKESTRVAEYREYADEFTASQESFLRGEFPRETNEIGLLSCTLLSDEAVPALRALDVDKELTNPFHRFVAHAVLDLSAEGMEHDAAAVTELLRHRGQLPLRFDPAGPIRPLSSSLKVGQSAPLDLDVPLRTVDPERYGLGAWQSTALPPASAATFTREIRTAYRADYVEAACIRGASLARAAGEDGLTGGPDLVGTALHRVAQELVNVPPELGPDLRPVGRGNSETGASIDTTMTPALVAHRASQDLGMPQHPTLSEAGRAVLSRTS